MLAKSTNFVWLFILYSCVNDIVKQHIELFYIRVFPKNEFLEQLFNDTHKTIKYQPGVASELGIFTGTKYL